MPEPALPQLRDIHLPDATSWWPPAPGWWLLALLLVLLPLAWYAARRRLGRRAPRYRRAALAELQQMYDNYQHEGNSLRFTQEVSALLKRVAMQCYPPEQVASLGGREWANFLTRDQDASTREHIDRCLGAIHRGKHTRDTDLQTDCTSLYEFTRDWIKAQEKF